MLFLTYSIIEYSLFGQGSLSLAGWRRQGETPAGGAGALLNCREGPGLPGEDTVKPGNLLPGEVERAPVLVFIQDWVGRFTLLRALEVIQYPG